MLCDQGFGHARPDEQRGQRPLVIEDGAASLDDSFFGVRTEPRPTTVSSEEA